MSSLPTREVISEGLEARIAIVEWPPSYANEAHSHEATEFVAVLSGSACLEYNVGTERATIDRLEQGETAVIARGVMHQVTAGSQGLRLLAVVVPNDRA